MVGGVGLRWFITLSTDLQQEAANLDSVLEKVNEN